MKGNQKLQSYMLMALVLMSGFWLTTSGKPYVSGIFTVHKLLAILGVITIFIFVRKTIKKFDIESNTKKMVITAFISVVLLLLSGGIMSLGDTLYGFIKILHLLTAFTGVFSCMSLIHILVTKKEEIT